jgi:hypothetical protein
MGVNENDVTYLHDICAEREQLLRGASQRQAIKLEREKQHTNGEVLRRASHAKHPQHSCRHQLDHAVNQSIQSAQLRACKFTETSFG